MRIADATVVVTGGRGFLGRHVTEELERHGAEAIALGTADYDLRRRAEAGRMLADTSPDAVVHLAAVVGGIGANRSEPGRFFYENALMGIELLEACRVGNVPKVVVSGTACAYPKHAPVPFQETGLWDGYPEETNAPYGLAKKMLLVQAQAYRAQYGMNAVYLMPVNLYGPHDNFDPESSHVVPAMIRKFVEAQDRRDRRVVLWGDGSPTRELLHVRDAARAFRLALERYDGGEPVNVGSAQEISIRDLAHLVAGATGYDGEIAWDPGKPNGQPRRRLATDRARAWLDFEATVPLRQGIPEVVDWYRRHAGADLTG
jgi:GDP-L-fucose synthase